MPFELIQGPPVFVVAQPAPRVLAFVAVAQRFVIVKRQIVMTIAAKPP